MRKTSPNYIVGFTITALLVCTVFSPGCLLREIPGVNSAFKKWDEAERQSQDKIIEGSKDFQLLRDECEGKRLDDFVLLERNLMNIKYPLLTYFYASQKGDRDGFAEFRRKFDDGWTEIESLSAFNETIAFQKGNVRATIQFGGMGKIPWSVSCSLEAPGAR